MAKQDTLNRPETRQTCYHCGDNIGLSHYQLDGHVFCCLACQGVYTILNKNHLTNYYRYNVHPGKEMKHDQQTDFHYLDEERIVTQLVDFKDDNKTIVSLYIPHIHCSSCIWLLENLYRINPFVVGSRVDFLKKQLRITFLHQQLSLKQLVELLKSIGYPPLISLLDATKQEQRKKQQDLLGKIAVAGFCFGNAMMISFPEYFGMADFEKKYAQLFGCLNLLFTLPAMMYGGQDYFTSAFKSIKQKALNLDVPLALGITVLFIRSCYDIVSGTGSGFSDTLCGLVFFLLIGRWVQQRTYHHLSFERDYRSYFPIAVTCLESGKEKTKTLAELQVGDRILVRNNEIVPADALLLQGTAAIDFSFVTGESTPVKKVWGEIIYAGGKQTEQAIELEVVKTVSNSYLTELWNHQDERDQQGGFRTFSNQVSRYFTIVLLALALGVALFWGIQHETKRAWDAFTTILIIACPCALALSSPFTLSSLMNLFDKWGFYLKHTEALEKMAMIDTLVFDKTGTITNTTMQAVSYQGTLEDREKLLVYSVCRNSNHPLSRLITQFLERQGINQPFVLDHYKEIAGKGIKAQIGNEQILIGNAALTGHATDQTVSTKVFILIDGVPKAYFSFAQKWRPGLSQLLHQLSQTFNLHLLSGDTDGDKTTLMELFPHSDQMHFNQGPKDKQHYLKNLQNNGKKVVMLGDGLNDAGALKQANLGIAITDDTNNFSPACDGILKGEALSKLPLFFKLAKQGMYIIYACFVISIAYNSIGLFFAAQGKLSPLFAAVLMPLSTFTIIAFTSLATRFCGRKLKNNPK